MPNRRSKIGIGRVDTPANSETSALRAEMELLRQAIQPMLDSYLEFATAKPTPKEEVPAPSLPAKRRGCELSDCSDDDSSAFQTIASSRMSKKPARFTLTDIPTPISTCNSFESLDDVTLSEPTPEESTQTTGPVRNPATAASSVFKPKNRVWPKRPPPIILHDVPPKGVKATTKAIMDTTNETAELRCRGANISVFTRTSEHWEAVKKLATSHQLQYHTYTPKEDRCQAWVMRGAHVETSPEEIKQELLEKFQISARVSAMTRRKREDGTTKVVAIPLFQVLLEPNINYEKLLQIRTIGYFRVTWEKKHARRQLTQCYNCQRFGHSASNCGLTHRCVKCKLDHKPGECANTPELNLKAQCVNCGQEHPANFGQCPARIRFLAHRAPKPTPKSDVVANIINNITQSRTIQNPSFTQKGISYAQAAANHNIQSGPSAPSAYERLVQESTNRFGLDFLTLETKCQQFFSEYDRITDPSAQTLRLLRFIATLSPTRV